MRHARRDHNLKNALALWHHLIFQSSASLNGPRIESDETAGCGRLRQHYQCTQRFHGGLENVTPETAKINDAATPPPVRPSRARRRVGGGARRQEEKQPEIDDIHRSLASSRAGADQMVRLFVGVYSGNRASERLRYRWLRNLPESTENLYELIVDWPRGVIDFSTGCLLVCVCTLGSVQQVPRVSSTDCAMNNGKS